MAGFRLCSQGAAPSLTAPGQILQSVTWKKVGAGVKRLLRSLRAYPPVLAVAILALRGLRGVGLFRSRRIYRHVPFRGVVTVACGARSFCIRSCGHNIENGLYWEGLFAHEPESMRIWVEAAASAGTVLDIGANSGVFALAAACAGARSVHAFEPLPRVHAILAGNVSLNPGLPIQSWSVAIGDKDGTAAIYDPGGEAPTSASLSADFSASNFGATPTIEVPVRSVDAFCGERGITSIDLVKIDVEGYEDHALRGMQATVANSRPLILMEVLPGQESVLRSLVEALWPGLYWWSPVDEGEAHVSRNVLLLPKRHVSGDVLLPQ